MSELLTLEFEVTLAKIELGLLHLERNIACPLVPDESLDPAAEAMARALQQLFIAAQANGKHLGETLTQMMRNGGQLSVINLPQNNQGAQP